MKVFDTALPAALALGAVLLGSQALAPAKAGLGETVASVQADRVSMKGQLRARSGAGYTVQQITTSAGTTVKEFVSPSGTVFAVSWSGPAVPNLQQLLGTYFAQFETAEQTQRAQRLRSGHNHLEVRSPALVVHAGGHMRQYFGVAYAPALLPPNLSLSDLH
jgi:hypothetical protein